MRAEKESIAKEIRDKVEGSVFVILADYQGMTVAETQDLKKRLGGDTGFQVVKNRLLNLADERLGSELKGPSAMLYGAGDVVQAAKSLREFIKETGRPVVKVGALEGAILSAADIEALASLPSKEMLQTKLVCTLAAPMSQLVGVLSQKKASVVYALKAYLEKQEAA
jgi:large subunit ribosomal protein L10